MANLRILYDNVADSATVTATAASASLAASNMLTDLKSQPYRSTGTSATITLDWASAVPVQAIILPCTNMTASATIRVRAYNGATLLSDSGTNPATPGASTRPFGWAASQVNVNSFGFGGGVGARYWMPGVLSVTKIIIDLANAGNPMGYIEVSRLLVGTYWESSKNADYGAALSMKDSSVQARNDAGDLTAELGSKARSQTLPLSKLGAADRTALWRIIDINGSGRPMFLSLYPDDTDGDLEQDHMMWCRLAPSPSINTPSFRLYASNLEFVEM